MFVTFIKRKSSLARLSQTNNQYYQPILIANLIISPDLTWYWWNLFEAISHNIMLSVHHRLSTTNSCFWLWSLTYINNHFRTAENSMDMAHVEGVLVNACTMYQTLKVACGYCNTSCLQMNSCIGFLIWKQQRPVSSTQATHNLRVAPAGYFVNMFSGRKLAYRS